MTEHSRHISIVLVGILCIFTAAAVGTAKEAGEHSGKIPSYALKYTFSTDTTLTYNATFTQRISSEFNGQSSDIGAVAQGTFSLTGNTTDDNGNTVITVLTDSLTAEHLGSLAGRSIDAGACVGNEFLMTISPRGSISTFSGNDTLRTGMGFNGPGRFLASDFFKYYGGNFFPHLPSTPLQADEPLIEEESYVMPVSPLDMHFSTKNTYTVLGRETIDGIACLKIHLQTTGTIDTPANDNPVTLEGDLEADTDFWFDVERGRIVKCSYNGFIEAAMSREGHGVIAYSLENQISYQLVK